VPVRRESGRGVCRLLIDPDVEIRGPEVFDENCRLTRRKEIPAFRRYMRAAPKDAYQSIVAC